MEIIAKSRFIRQSPRKVRLVSDMIKGLPATVARDQLKFLAKKASAIVAKTLDSAVANAEHNNKLKVENLFVARVFVDQGPTIKRFTTKAFGRGATIRKRTSHLTIVLADKREKSKNSKLQIPKSKQISNPKSKTI